MSKWGKCFIAGSLRRLERRLPPCACSRFCRWHVSPARPPSMSVEEIRPGMVGVGRTVFDGTRVEEFKANIIGVLENVIGPNRNLILAKLEGGPLANTGVIAGMSGSPVYVDGKFIGAVSYALGSFSKEPIAGITPIGEMTDSASFSDMRPVGARVRIQYPVTKESLVAAFRSALNWNRPFAERPGRREGQRPRTGRRRSRPRSARDVAAPDCDAPRDVRVRARCRRSAWERVSRSRIHPDWRQRCRLEGRRKAV